MSRLLQKRFLAALLPFSFLWAWMACVSICERESLANHPSTELAYSNGINEIRHEPACDGCPLSYFPKATTPERIKSILALGSVASFAPATSLNHSSEPDVLINQFDRPLGNGSPPPKLLPTLRI